MTYLIIDAHSGCSGDMFVAALSQLANVKATEAALQLLPQKLGLKQVRLQFTNVERSSIACRKFDVLVENNHNKSAFTILDPHEHTHADGHTHSHGHAHSHLHAPHHVHADHHHEHEHRGLSQIKMLIQNADLSIGCKQRAIDIFQRLGAVEAQAHGIPIEDVHFHEVGAIDSIIDIVAAAFCLDLLQITATYISAICVGHGQVKTAHGLLPIPAPATEKLLHGYPTQTGEIPGEWCTPTGAAIIAHLQPSTQLPTLVCTASAFGGGGKNPSTRPNALRLRLANLQPEKSHRDPATAISVIQCNVDDMPSELLGADFTQAALEHGARDICIRPQLMKKGRPGFLIEILCLDTDKQKMAEFLCTHTTTIGVRMFAAERYVLQRRQTQLHTSHGDIAAKSVSLPDGSERCLPEYEACAELARQLKLPVLQIYQEALRSAQNT